MNNRTDCQEFRQSVMRLGTEFGDGAPPNAFPLPELCADASYDGDVH